MELRSDQQVDSINGETGMVDEGCKSKPLILVPQRPVQAFDLMSQLLKALTIATVITGIVGAVAGVFGMNFDTPIPHTGMNGFLLVTGGMLFASVALVAVALWRRWL